MTEITVLDIAGFAVIALTAAIVTLATYAWQEHAAATRQRVRAEENFMWAEHHRTEADDARARVHVLERRYATLQSLYADHVRRRLAENYPLIERNITWKRQRRS